jgi:hypothetical protein
VRGVEDGQSDHAGAVKNVNPGADYLDTTRRPNQQGETTPTPHDLYHRRET